MNSYSYQNIIDGNGFGMTFTGMAIVFISLAVIASSIALLPKLLLLLDKVQGNGTNKELEAASLAAESDASVGDEEAIMTAIGLVVHMELDRISVEDQQRITISKQVDQRSMWSAAGKMKTFSRREKYA